MHTASQLGYEKSRQSTIAFNRLVQVYTITVDSRLALRTAEIV